MICYLDDILVTGHSTKEHFRNLEKVLCRLKEHGVKLKKGKCVFFQESVEYLGHVVDAQGVRTSPKKVQMCPDHRTFKSCGHSSDLSTTMPNSYVT